MFSFGFIIFPDICGVALGVCDTTFENIEGNVSKLKKLEGSLVEAEQKLKAINDEISSLKETETRLENKQRERDALKNRLEEYQGIKEKYEELCKECSSMKEQTDALQNCDIAEKTKEIENLQMQYNDLEKKVIDYNNTITELQSKIDVLEKKNTELQNQCGSLEKTIDDCEKKKAIHEESVAELTKKCDCIEKENSRLEETVLQLVGKYNESENHKAELEKKNSQLVKEYEEFCKNELSEVENKNKELNERILNQNEVKNSRNKLYNELQSKYNQLLVENSEILNETLLIESSIKSKSEEVNLLTEKKNKLDKKNSEVSLKLATLQTNVAKVKEITDNIVNNLIPQAEESYLEAKKDQDLKRQKYHELNNAIQSVNKELKSLETAYSDCCKELETRQKYLEELQSKYTINNKEIESLKNQLADLKGKTSEEGLAAIRHQLEDEIKKHDKLISAKMMLEQECKNMCDKNKEDELVISKLTVSKNQYESDRKKLDKSLEELRFLNSDQFKTKADVTVEKLQYVLKIRNRLEKSSEKLSRVLNYSNDAVCSGLDDNINADLDEIRDYLYDLIKNIRSAANCMIERIAEG